jgi:hypothetical protein
MKSVGTKVAAINPNARFVGPIAEPLASTM